MRRPLLAVMLAGIAVVAPAAQAAPSPQLSDRAGDWALPAQDLLNGRLSSRLVGGKPMLVGELKLADKPAPGAVTNYGFFFGVGCRQYGFTYTWAGAAEQSVAQFQQTSFCTPRPITDAAPDRTYPVTFSVKGTTLTWQTPYVGGIKRGTRVEGFAGVACTGLCGVIVGLPVTTANVPTGDMAFGQGRYVVGSDLPRR